MQETPYMIPSLVGRDEAGTCSLALRIALEARVCCFASDIAIHKLQALHRKLCNEIQGGMLTFAPQRQTLSRPRVRKGKKRKKANSQRSQKSRVRKYNKDSTHARNLRSVRGHAGTTCTVRRGLAWRVWPRRRRLRPPRRLAFRGADAGLPSEVSFLLVTLPRRHTKIYLGTLAGGASLPPAFRAGQVNLGLEISIEKSRALGFVAVHPILGPVLFFRISERTNCPNRKKRPRRSGGEDLLATFGREERFVPRREEERLVQAIAAEEVSARGDDLAKQVVRAETDDATLLTRRDRRRVRSGGGGDEAIRIFAGTGAESTYIRIAVIKIRSAGVTGWACKAGGHHRFRSLPLRTNAVQRHSGPFRSLQIPR